MNDKRVEELEAALVSIINFAREGRIETHDKGTYGVFYAIEDAARMALTPGEDIS